MALSVKPPNNQKQSVTAPNQPFSVKPPNTQVQSAEITDALNRSVKPPNT
jgi:hypothetical protein